MGAAKIWLILAICILFIGIVIFGAVMTMLNWDFSKLSTVKYETNTYEIDDDFTSLSINTNTADVKFELSTDSKCSVVCHEQEKVNHSVSVKKGTLEIDVVDSRKWYDHIGINFGTPTITVYLPKSEYESLKMEDHTGDILIPDDFKFKSINVTATTGEITCLASATADIKLVATTGDICVENISAGSLDISVSTGKVTVSKVSCKRDIGIRVSTGKTSLSSVTCKNLTSDGNTGDIYLGDVIASGKFSIERSTGNVNFDKSDAAEIFVTTDTGNVKGSLLTEKVFIVRTDTGDIDVPKSITGGRCEITTDTGNIRINVN